MAYWPQYTACPCRRSRATSRTIAAAARAPTRGATRAAPGLALGAALLLGATVRFSYVLPATAPLNDGGLFYSMVEDLQRAGFALPLEASYNAASIPFVYPPLAFYLAGLLATTGPWSLLDVFRILPLGLSVLTIAAFFALARALWPVGSTAGWATVAFALLPMSFHWLIMGGGLTRGLGFSCALLALRQVYFLSTRPRWQPVFLGAVFAAATVLSHPAMAWFLAYSSVVFLLAFGRRRAARWSLALAAGSLLLTAPWWVTILLRHGAGPLLASGGTGISLFAPLQLVTLTLSNEPFFPVLGALAILGALACLRQQWYWLPGWVLVMAALDARSPLASATVPLALLAGVGLSEALLPWLDRLQAEASLGSRPARWPSRLRVLVLAWGLLLVMLNATVDKESVLVGLTPDQQTALAWVSAATPPDSTFLVVTGQLVPTRDRVAEWFPALARRASVLTVQGYEWVPGDAFARRVAAYPAAQRCALRDAACLEAWARAAGVSFSHVFVPKGPTGAIAARGIEDDCCWALRHALRQDAHFQTLYDGPGATVFRTRESGATP